MIGRWLTSATASRATRIRVHVHAREGLPWRG